MFEKAKAIMLKVLMTALRLGALKENIWNIFIGIVDCGSKADWQ